MGSASKQKTPKRLLPLSVASLGDGSCSCSETEAHLDDNSDMDDSELLLSYDMDMDDDGVMEDEALKRADALSKEEVVRRRARRVRQLMKLYRMQYWSLMEELRAKYRIFYLRHGRSGYRDEAEMEEKERLASIDGPIKQMGIDKSRKRLVDGSLKDPIAMDSSYGRSGYRDEAEMEEKERLTSMDGPIKQMGIDKSRKRLADGSFKDPIAMDSSSSLGSIKCSFQGCKSKPLALSTFCFAHILSDPLQQLYKPCEYAIRSGQTGPVTCGKPVLRAVNPCFCPAHLQQAQKQAARSVKKGPLGVATAAKPTLKLHLIVAEYVRLIQNRRRGASDLVLNPVTGISENDAVNVSAASLQQEQAPQSTSQA